MKKSILIAFAAVCIAGPAMAQDWSRYDTNRNGRLDRNEWQQLQSRVNNNDSRYRNDWSRFDTNRNGRIDPHERNQWMDQYNNWSRQEWRAYDRNGDGRLSKGERKQWEKRNDRREDRRDRDDD